MFQSLLYEINNGAATITLNRPEVFNAFNDEMSYELQDALKQSAKDKSVRVVVITGAGKAFCSGQDLKASAGAGKRSFLDSLHKRYNPIIRAIRNMNKPVIGKLNGVAAGAGCSLALACDMLIASENVQLIEVFINVGLVPDSGSSWFLPRLIGPARAFEMCTMGSRISAAQAMQWGIVNRVCKPEELDAETQKLVDYFSSAPTKSIGMIKKMLNKAATADLETVLEYEAWCQETAGNSADHQEGLKSFLEKRKPEFKGE